MPPARRRSPSPTASWATRSVTGRTSRRPSKGPSSSRRPSEAKGQAAGSALESWRRQPREAGSWVPPPLEAQLEAIGFQDVQRAVKDMAEQRALELDLAELYPEKHGTWVEMNKLQRILQPLSPLFLPQLVPIPDSFMFDSKETCQSFKDYVLERPPAASRAHHRIYLLPLSEPSRGQGEVGNLPDLRIFQRFIEAWFHLPCRVLPYEPLLRGKGIASRENGHGSDLQYHAQDSLRQIRIRLPMDGFCILGLAMEDLYDSSESFVHSSVSLRDRAGIISLCRLDPGWYRVGRHMDLDAMTLKDLHLTERREGDLETLLRRSHTLIAHDLGLLFGMRNCQFYLCRMQGSSGLHESDTNQDKVDLCPVCLRKLSWNRCCSSYEPPEDLSAWCLQRYRRLLSHAERLGSSLQSYKLWLRGRLQNLDFAVLPAAAVAEATKRLLPEPMSPRHEELVDAEPLALSDAERVERERQLLMLFAHHDSDGDGRMKVKEFIELIAAVDESFSSLSAMKMFEQADVNKDGSVDVKELLEWLLLPDDPGEASQRIVKKLAADSKGPSKLDHDDLDFLPMNLS